MTHLVTQWLGSAELETMDYLEFIARVVSRIPNKGQVMARYYSSLTPVPRILTS